MLGVLRISYAINNSTLLFPSFFFPIFFVNSPHRFHRDQGDDVLRQERRLQSDDAERALAHRSLRLR